MTRTAVACPEPERPRNEPVWHTATTTTTNATVAWVRVEVRR